MTPEQMRALTDEEAIDFIAKKGVEIEDWENNYVVAEVKNRVIALARKGADAKDSTPFSRPVMGQVG